MQTAKTKAGDGLPDGETQNLTAVPAPNPARKAGPRSTSIGKVPTGAPHSPTSSQTAGGGHASLDAQSLSASPATQPADPHAVGGGEDRAIDRLLSKEKVPDLATPMPAVKRGRSRKATAPTLSTGGLPTGITNTDDQQEVGREVRATMVAISNIDLPDLAPSPDLTVTVDALRSLQRQRVFAIKSQIRQDNAVGALIRTIIGWSKGLPEKERKAIEDRARAVIAAVEKGRMPDDPRDAAVALNCRAVILASKAARLPFDTFRTNVENDIRDHAQTLPVWPWVKAIRGFGPIGLGVIVGEAGNLSKYANPAKLWKRMGLALVGSDIQGKPSIKTNEAWIEHGYSPRRRSVVWNMGDSLIKQNHLGGGDGRYRRVYDERKAYEVAAAEAAGLRVVPAAKVPAGRANEFRSQGHVHNRAKRYTEKRLLKHLWQAWRREPTED